MRAGDVYITVQEVPHAVFERKGNDLKTVINISLEEALLGFQRTLTHLDGHQVLIDRADRTTKPGL